MEESVAQQQQPSSLSNGTSSRDEIESRHRKEMKQWEGEKRAAIKKAKSTKGKKAKEELANVETEYEQKRIEMEQRHQLELEPFINVVAAAAGGGEACGGDGIVDNDDQQQPEDDTATAAPNNNKKLEKLRQKREKKRLEELERQRQLEDDINNAGPSMRDVEMEQICTQFTTTTTGSSSAAAASQQPLYEIVPITADGHCLYRAIAYHLQQQPQQRDNTMDYQRIRQLCADTLLAHAEEYAPFCEYNDNDDNNDDVDQKFQHYVNAVRNSSQWGGHLELRALSCALQRPIHVYSAATAVATASSSSRSGGKPQPLIIDGRTNTTNSDDNDDTVEPIRLSYHLHYYALGEHYNAVVVPTATS